MAEECTWDPSKHNGQACPKHGNGGKSEGYSTSIKGGKWKLKRDNADEEDISEEEYNELRGNEHFDDNDEEELEYTDKKYNNWTEVYDNEFSPIVGRLLHTKSGPSKITKEVDKLYAKHKGEPAWDEAYKRWMSTSEDNEDEEEFDSDEEETRNYSPIHKAEELDGAKFFPSESRMDKDNNWIGTHYSIADAYGTKTMDDIRRVFSLEKGDETGDVFKTPDGYYTRNPFISTIAFKNLEDLKNFEKESIKRRGGISEAQFYLESKGRKNNTWNDVYYNEFSPIVKKYPLTKSGMAKIDKEIDELYAKHKGEPIWDEAYKRWMDSDNIA